MTAGVTRHNGGVFSPSVENLVAQLTRLPGVGSRTAQRLAFHILQGPKEEALALAAALEEVKERVRFCRDCGNLTEEELCGICTDARRDHAVICVVEQPVDVVSLERTHEFFVIEDGAAEVRKDGERIAELGPGDFFGEIGLLETDRRTASVVATTPMRVIVMFQREFKQMEREMPAVATLIRSAIRARLDNR